MNFNCTCDLFSFNIYSKNLQLKVDFLLQSFLFITVLEILEKDFQNMKQNLSENDEMKAILRKYVIEQKITGKNDKKFFKIFRYGDQKM